MGRKRIVRGQEERRGIGRAALLIALLVLALAAGGCGKSGQGAETDPEKGADAELLNAALGQELTLLRAYTEGRPLLEGFSPVARQLRAHQQEYVDAITKALRGLGGETEAEAAAVDLADVESEADLLALVYELENAAYAGYVDAAPRLFTDAPRTLAASLAAAHARHLVTLRQGLGASLAGAMTDAFESGEEPPPEAGSGQERSARAGR